MSGGSNLFAAAAAAPGQEESLELHAAGGLRIKRIVSPPGYSDPPDRWHDQDCDEWVAVLAGTAGLHFAQEAAPRALRSGDHLHIPAHARHRVAWTDPDRATVWLAVYHLPPETIAPTAR